MLCPKLQQQPALWETVNRRFKELWENRSLVFPQLRQFSTRFSRRNLRYAVAADTGAH